MAALIPNKFTSYQLTDQELHEGSKLTVTQKQIIQTQIAEFASQLISLEPDPANMTQYLQQHAHSLGAIQALTYLVEVSNSLEEDEKLQTDISKDAIYSDTHTSPFDN